MSAGAQRYRQLTPKAFPKGRILAKLNYSKAFGESLSGGTTIAAKRFVNKTSNIPAQSSEVGDDMVDLMEEMLFQRASNGIRPVLYVSSYTDLECSMLMLLDDLGDVQWSGTRQPATRQVGYHIVPS